LQNQPSSAFGQSHDPAASPSSIPAYEHPGDPTTVLGVEAYALTKLELQHRGMRAELGEHPQTSDDPVVEVDELGFRQSVERTHGRAARHQHC